MLDRFESQRPDRRLVRPLDIWKAWAGEVRGGPIPAGHFIAEEAPDLTARYLTEFLA